MLIAAVSILLGQIQIQDKIFAYNTSTERWWHATCVVCLSRWQRSRKKRCWWFANNLKIKLTQHSKLSAMIHVIFNLCRSDLLFIFYVFSFLAFTLRKILIPILSSRSVVNVFFVVVVVLSHLFIFCRRTSIIGSILISVRYTTQQPWRGRGVDEHCKLQKKIHWNQIGRIEISRNHAPGDEFHVHFLLCCMNSNSY